MLVKSVSQVCGSMSMGDSIPHRSAKTPKLPRHTVITSMSELLALHIPTSSAALAVTDMNSAQKMLAERRRIVRNFVPPEAGTNTVALVQSNPQRQPRGRVIARPFTLRWQSAGIPYALGSAAKLRPKPAGTAGSGWLAHCPDARPLSSPWRPASFSCARWGRGRSCGGGCSWG
jgi:hypothetical protein